MNSTGVVTVVCLLEEGLQMKVVQMSSNKSLFPVKGMPLILAIQLLQDMLEEPVLTVQGDFTVQAITQRLMLLITSLLLILGMLLILEICQLQKVILQDYLMEPEGVSVEDGQI